MLMKKGSVQQKKIFYPISNEFREYLDNYKRTAELPVHYENLLQSVDSYPLINAKNISYFVSNRDKDIDLPPVVARVKNAARN